MKHIILTGGGTAGHVTPNIALIPLYRKKVIKFLTSAPTMVLKNSLLRSLVFLTMELLPVN